MIKGYRQLADENKVLYAQLERCTLLMDRATADGDFKLHAEYSTAKINLKQLIDNNLDLIEKIWETPIIIKEPVTGRKRMFFEERIIAMYRNNTNLTIEAIAHRTHNTKAVVEDVLTRHMINQQSLAKTY